MDRNEVPHNPRHLGVLLGASKMIFVPMLRLVQPVHLYGIKISTISKWTEVNIYGCLTPSSTIGCVHNDF
jgi:hypothetical protein